MTPYVVAVHKTYTTQVTGEVRHGVAPHFTFMFNSFVLIGANRLCKRANIFCKRANGKIERMAKTRRAKANGVEEGGLPPGSRERREERNGLPWNVRCAPPARGQLPCDVIRP